MRSIDASRPCGSNAGIFIEFGQLMVETRAVSWSILFRLSLSLSIGSISVALRSGRGTPINLYNHHNESAPLYHYYGNTIKLLYIF
jgi:hypothetical protein